MNIKRIEALANFIESELTDQQFDMHLYSRAAECGTVCCIAGWATYLAHGRDDLKFAEMVSGVRSESMHEKAEEWLGLSCSHALELFLPDENAAYTASREQVAGVLRRLTATGVVDWSMS